MRGLILSTKILVIYYWSLWKKVCPIEALEGVNLDIKCSQGIHGLTMILLVLEDICGMESVDPFLMGPTFLYNRHTIDARDTSIIRMSTVVILHSTMVTSQQ